jgi:hypothetical protein
MDRISFSSYDFFGYLASGLFFLVGMELVFGFPTVLARNFTVVESALLLLAMYVTGQIVAIAAKAILEDLLVARILRRPNVNLLQSKKPLFPSLIFPCYYQPLPDQARKRILDRAQRQGTAGAAEDLFLHVRYSPEILENTSLLARLNNFLNQYGFHRNLSFSGLVVGAALLLKLQLSVDVNAELRNYALLALTTGVLLFYRYLKFFRQYSYEMFNAYGSAKSEP